MSISQLLDQRNATNISLNALIPQINNQVITPCPTNWDCNCDCSYDCGYDCGYDCHGGH